MTLLLMACYFSRTLHIFGDPQSSTFIGRIL